MAVPVEIPEAFLPLFEPKRYKVFYGGRGGAKSHSIARALLIIGWQERKRILCARELQNSVADSVHRLLADLIRDMRLDKFYTITEKSIVGRNGTEIFYAGLKHNVGSIKSKEAIDICWVEEADNVSDNSWEKLIPTIRRRKSEIWISFNTKNLTDPTYQRFVVNQDEDMIVKKVLWEHNPFLTWELEKERLKLLRNDKPAYDHVWGGEPDVRFSGAVYASYIESARSKGRITNVPYKPGVPVITAWDLGKRHATCIWFAQQVGREARIIDYHEAYGDDTDIEALAAVIKKKEYLYDMHWLPHDAKHERMGMKGSISKQLTDAGIINRLLPNIAEKAGIQKAINLLKEVWIDKESTRDGVHGLSHFHYKYDEALGRFKDDPYDDWSKDAADSFRYLAIALDQRLPSDLRPAGMLSVSKPVAWSVI